MEPMKPMAPMPPMQPMESGPAWWPEGLGTPASSGGQNDVRYAFFPEARRLAIRRAGEVALYDTGDHRITGVAQQQGSGGSLAFTSQRGEVRLEALQKLPGG